MSLLGRIQELRKLHGNISINKLAQESGVNVRVLQDYEQGRRDINKASVATVHRLALALGCKMENIMELEK